jgi:hypothetical protein
MIGVYIQTLIFADAGNISLTHVITVGLGLVRFDEILDKINATLLDIKNQGHVVANCDTGLDSVFLADCSDAGSQFCFKFLGYVCHFVSPFR